MEKKLFKLKHFFVQFFGLYNFLNFKRRSQFANKYVFFEYYTEKTVFSEGITILFENKKNKIYIKHLLR